jgi:hypothetical protein
MKEKAINLAKKLHAISTRGGSEGEMETATRMLEEFMAKNGITWDDIEVETRKRRMFYTPKIRHRLFFQLIGHVTGDRASDRCYGVNGRASYTYAELTDAEFAEVQLKYDFYWKLYEEEFDIFETAFIHRNKLFRYVDNLEEREPTPEELERARRISDMAMGIKRDSPTIRIENKK